MYETRYMQGMSNFNADQLLLVVWVVAISGLISFTLPTFITANHFLHQSALEVIVTILLIAPDDFTNNLAGTVWGTARVRVVICYLISWWMSSSEKSPDCCHHTFTDRDPFESISAPCWQDTPTSQTHHTLHRLQFMYLNIAVSLLTSAII